MASTGKEKEVSLVPKEDGYIAEMKTQHEDETQEDWDFAFNLKKLRHTKCSLLLERFLDSNTLLHVAASLGHDEIVKAILSVEQCPDLLMVKNSSGDIPLHVAANAGHLSIVQCLVNSSHNYQELITPRDSSIEYCFPDPYASKLLRVKNNENNTPLHLALIKKYEEVDLNLKTKYCEVAKFLIEKDTDAYNDFNMAGNSPLSMAEKAQDRKLQKLMEGYLGYSEGAAFSDAVIQKERNNSIIPDLGRAPHKSKDKVTSMDPELYNAVKSMNIDFIKAQDPEHSALSDKTPELNTILHLAAASSDDNHQFVQTILEIPLFRKFVTEKNSNGDLPLHVAASAGNKQIVELLAASVPLMEKNMEENTPLHLALIKKFQVGRNSALKAKYNKVAKFMVEKCPEVSFYPNKERKSPLYLAAKGGDEELVKHMITKNRLTDGKSIVHAALYYLRTITNLPDGISIVHTAIYGSFTVRKKDILDTVLKSLPDDILTVKDDKSMTPLFYAASIGYLDGVEILLKKPTKCGAYDQRDTDGYYPIHIASRKGHIQVIKKFLDKYPDMIELLNEEGQNILHVAAMYGKAKVVAHLLKRHDLKVVMLINNEDKNGNTPLHLAAKKGHPMVVSILTWDKRVDLKALNKEGKRALDIALNDSGENPSFGERLTWEALRYVSGPRGPLRRINRENPQSSTVEKTLSTDKYKERTDTLLLVATLVATVTFAAAFTMPGGYNGPGGMATFLEKPMFQVFVISNTIAMYSAITAVIALIWAHLGDLKLFIAAYKFSLPILGLAITTVSLAFMAGNYLVLRDLNWLAYLVLSTGSFFLFTLSIIFFPLFLPNSSPHPIIRYLLRYPFYLLIMFTRCDTDDREGE